MKKHTRASLFSTTAMAGLIGVGALLASSQPAHADCTPGATIGDDIIICTGTTTGDQDTLAGNDTLDNSGAIEGNVLLGDGEDILTLWNSATITGTIDGGAGLDILILAIDAGNTFSFDISTAANIEFVRKQSPGTLILAGTASFERFLLDTGALENEADLTLTGSSGVTANINTQFTNIGSITMDVVNGTAVVARDNTRIENFGDLNVTATGNARGINAANSGVSILNDGDIIIRNTGGSISSGISVVSHLGIVNSGLIDVSLTLTAQPQTTRAGGILANGLGPTIDNSGIINVNAEGFATGIGARNGTVTNDGEINVISTNQGAIGIDLDELPGGSSPIINNGIINVSGTFNFGGPSAVGINGRRETPITNNGEITAVSMDPVAPSYGILVTHFSVDVVPITNSGTITADIAIKRIKSVFLVPPVADIVTNSGTINGAIVLSDLDDDLSNTGSIIGDLDGGMGFDTLTNGAGGSIRGAVMNFESVSNSGFLSIRSSDGIFSLAGDLTLTGTSDFKIKLDSTGPVPIQIAGVATLAGTLTVDFSFSAGTDVFPGDRFTVLTAGGGVTGSFASVDFGSSSFVEGSLIQSANAVEIELVRSSFLLPFFDAGRRAIASQLDAMASGGVLGVAGDFIQEMTFTERQFAGLAIDQLSTLAAADIATPIIEARHGFLSHLAGRSMALTGKRAAEGRWISSISGFGEFGSGASSKFATSGAIAVSSYGVNDRLNVGFALAGTASNLNIDAQFGDNGHRAFDIALFVAYRTGNLALTGALGGSYDEADTERSVLLADFQGRANGSASGVGYSAAVDARYDLRVGDAYLVPQAAVRMASFHHGEYEETELGNLGLRINGRTVTSARASAGLSLRQEFKSVGGLTLTPKIGAFYEREFGDRSRNVTASFIADPTSSFSITGQSVARQRLRASGGLSARFSDRISANFEYQGAFGVGYDIHRVVGGLRVNW